jgi:hypothetical protein
VFIVVSDGFVKLVNSVLADNFTHYRLQNRFSREIEFDCMARNSVKNFLSLVIVNGWGVDGS